MGWWRTVSRHDIATALPWVRDGTAVVLAAVDGLDDTDVGEPSLLAGRSRAHLVGHLARNGEALARLPRGPAPASRTPCTPDLISGSSTSTRPVANLLRSCAGTPGPPLTSSTSRWPASTTPAGRHRFAALLDGPSPPRRSHGCAGAKSGFTPWTWAPGRPGPTSPPEVIDALADDGLEGLGARNACPSAFLEPTDRTVTWRLGPAPEPSVVVGRPAAGLVAWLLGRDDGSTLVVAGGPLPVLPRWL